MKRRRFLALIPAALAAGCGFQLRRYDGLPFASLYIDAPGGSAVAQRLRTMLATVNTISLTATAAEAAAVLKITQEERVKSILTLTGGGRVSEYRLTLRIGYAVLGKDGVALAAPETFELVRSMTYDDSLLLAKGAEEQLLYRDLVENAALRIVRRMQTLQPAAAAQ
jgi:LPS-assembly lipoprotein